MTGRRKSAFGTLQRPDFLKLRHHGQKSRRPAFFIQALQRANGDGCGPRVGFTITKKTGNAVERNRIRRRLREALRANAAHWLENNHDYAIIAHREMLDVSFTRLISDLDTAFLTVHKRLAGGSKDRKPNTVRKTHRNQTPMGA